MASRTQLKYRGLGVMEQNLWGLKVDDELLKRMKKWDCLTQKHVDDLQKKPEAKRLHSMMQCLEKRGPCKWSLLVCVLLEIGQGKMAKSTWRDVLEQVRHLRQTGKQKEAMDVWDAFVRRMSVALVLDQQPGQEGQGKWEKPLKDGQRKTASEIWKEIVKETVKQRYRSASDLYMWKILVNCVTNMLSISGLKTDYGLWEELATSVLDRLNNGDKEASLLMYKYLVGKAKSVAFSREVLNHIWKVMVDIMLKVQNSNQYYFVDDVKKALVELLWNLFGSHDLRSQESASHLFMLLRKSIPTFLEKDTCQNRFRREKGARKTAKALWKALVDLVKGLPEDSKQNKMLEDLFCLVDQLRVDESADNFDLQEMRADLPSGSSSMEEEHQGSDIDAGGDASSTVPQSDAPLIGVYPMRPQSSGLALVINNVDFSDETINRRDGSEMDELALVHLLRRLNFHVQQETNLSKIDLHRAIAAFADRPEHAEADVAVLAVMTHGRNEALVGADGGDLAFQTVVKCFSNDNAPNLAGKPKWLSFHACRDKSEEEEDSDHKPDISEPLDYPDGDMLITFTTRSGCKAMRSTVKGTWYVQALKDALDMPQAHELSLSELHKKAQKTMSDIWKKEMAKHGDAETPPAEQKLDVKKFGWTKELYFRSTRHS